MIKKTIKSILKSLGIKRFQSQNLINPTMKDWEAFVANSVKRPVKMILPYLKSGDVFIDVGANVGAYTQAILRKRPNVNAHLFEPIPKYNERVKAKFSSFNNVIINNVALSDQTGSFNIWASNENFGWNTMIENKTTDNMTEITIDAILFDDYATKHNLTKIDAIKIDVEGAEYKVLSGMKKTLSSLEKKPLIVCEIGWGKGNHPNWSEEVEIFEWLFDNGYQRFDYDSITSTSDVIFYPL